MSNYEDELVTFKQPPNAAKGTPKGQKVTWVIRITPAAYMLVSSPDAAGYKWCARWDSELAYPNGDRISENDEIVWTGIQAAGNIAVLRSVVPSHYMGRSRAYFEEVR